MSVKAVLRSGVQKWLSYRYTKIYHDLYRTMVSKSPELGEKAEGEEAWLDKWKRYDRNLSPLAYRIFSRFIGKDLNIMPMELCMCLVEPILNPAEYLHYYSDKNSFGKIFQGIKMPYVYARNIRGFFFDNDYNHLEKDPLSELLQRKVEGFVLKPSLEESGRGVKLFRYDNGHYISNDHTVFSLDLLNEVYKQDYLIQECVSQGAFNAYFNPTSVNTIRMATYRDVKTGEVHYLRAVMRIGKCGMELDNSHAGGSFVGIDGNGVLGKYLCNQWGERMEVFNGIDFRNNTFKVPDYEKIKQFAIRIGEQVAHHDMVAMDIAIDAENRPQLIEINVGGFSGKLFQLTSGTVFGDHTDEVMEYVTRKMKESELKISFYRK